jgi:hypothetical protein
MAGKLERGYGGQTMSSIGTATTMTMIDKMMNMIVPTT